MKPLPFINKFCGGGFAHPYTDNKCSRRNKSIMNAMPRNNTLSKKNYPCLMVNDELNAKLTSICADDISTVKIKILERF